MRAQGRAPLRKRHEVDQLYRLHRRQPGQHGLYLVRLPQHPGAGAVSRLLRGAVRRGA